MPWMSALSDERGHTFKEWKKMVDQEVRYLLFNKMHSTLMVDGLLGNAEFIGFKKRKGKVGVDFEVHLTRPHWDNHRRIENAFEELVTIYRNQVIFFLILQRSLSTKLFQPSTYVCSYVMVSSCPITLLIPAIVLQNFTK